MQFPLARAHMALEAASLMRWKAVWLYEAGEHCGAEANMAKFLASEASFAAANAAIDTHGGFGFAAGVRRRAQVPRDPAVLGRAGVQQPRPGVRRPARPRPAAVLLMPAPLDDLVVLAVEQFGAGPFGTLQLADLGATVIKIEDPGSGGDVGRYVPPFRSGEDSLFFETFNRGKRSSRSTCAPTPAAPSSSDLVDHADAVTSNLRGDQPAKLGLTYDALKRRKPRIVCCSLSGFGMIGPRAASPATTTSCRRWPAG